MTKTTNYQLNQWDPVDRVIRTDFNEDNAKIDAALAAKAEADVVAATQAQVQAQLAGKADASALAALQTVVSGKGNCNVEFGTYVGQGYYRTPTVLRLGYQPQFIVILSDNAWAFFAQGLNSATFSCAGYNLTQIVTWLEDGLSWYISNSASSLASAFSQLNAANTTYYYIAFK